MFNKLKHKVDNDIKNISLNDHSTNELNNIYDMIGETPSYVRRSVGTLGGG